MLTGGTHSSSSCTVCLSHGGIDCFKDVARDIVAVLSSFPLCSSGVLSASRGANMDLGVGTVGDGTEKGPVSWCANTVGRDCAYALRG